MQKIIKYFLIPIFLFFVFFVFYNNIYKKISITYWDEQAWISRSYFFDLFIKKDFNNFLWESGQGNDQPKLAEYMYGAVLYPDYLKIKQKKGNNYDFASFLIDNSFYDVEGKRHRQYKNSLTDFVNWGPKDFEISPEKLLFKYGSGFKKVLKVIFPARKINVYLLSLNVVIVYYISILCFGFFPSLLVSLLFGSNNLIIEASLRAHSEGLFLLLFNLSMLILIMMVKNKKYSLYLLFAIIVGLLWQTKLNGVMMLIIFNIVFTTQIVINWFKSKKINTKYILMLLNVNILVFLIFINTNFYVIKSPVKNIINLYKYRYESAQQQAGDFPSSKLADLESRVVTIYKNYLFDRHYFKISDFLPKNINRIFNSAAYQSFYVVGFLLGMISGFISLVKKKNLVISHVLIIFLLIQTFMGQYLILNWDRYFIQLSLFFIIFSVLGWGNLLKYAKNIFKH